MADHAHFRHSPYSSRDDHPDFFVRTATIARQRQTRRYNAVYTSHGVHEGKRQHGAVDPTTQCSKDHRVPGKGTTWKTVTASSHPERLPACFGLIRRP